MRAALLVVDVQVDFCPGGALPVKNGDKVVPEINRIINAFDELGLPIFFTRDWHPANHISFKSQGGVWPPHCVQDSRGARFHPALRIPLGAAVISKGGVPEEEAYSGFQGTDLETRLRKLGVDEIVLCGLATDYCVKESALDALRAGFRVSVIRDCIRAVDVKPGDGATALSAMKKAGAKITASSSVIKQLASTQQWSHHPGLSDQS
jgi:nicotinamidase/pyrazinamidase